MNEDAGVSHTPANPTFSVFHDPVLRAAAWYAGKVHGAFPVVVLSDDRASTLNGGVNLDVNLASEMRRRLPPGVEVLAAHEYFPRFHSNDVDVMNAFESVREANEAAMKADEERKLLGLGEHGGGNRARAFAPHWDNDAIVGGLESGELMRGTIKVCRWRPEEATVRVGEDEERTDAADDGNDNTLETFGDVLVPSRTLRNRALDGDGVAVRLLPRSRWVPAEGAHTVAEGNSDSDSEEEDDTNGDEEKAGADDKKRTKTKAGPHRRGRRRPATPRRRHRRDHRRGRSTRGSTHTLEQRQIQQRPGHPDGPTIPPVPTTDPPRRRARGPTTGRSHHAVAGAQQTPGGAGGQGAREVRGFNGGGQRAVSGARHRNKRVFAGEFLFMYVRAIILD